MTLSFAFPGLLWCLAVLPLLWILHAFRMRREAVRRYGRLHLALRTTLVAALVLALGEPELTRSASRIALVHLVDLSDSVSSGSLSRVADAIDEIDEAVGPAVSTILGFGADDARLGSTAELRRISSGTGRDQLDRMISPGATNLEQALAAAMAEIPPGMSGRVVLFSDGRETDGEARRMAADLAAAEIPLFTRTVPTRRVPDTWIESVTASERPVAGAATRLDVVVGSYAAGEALVEVRVDERVAGTRAVALEASSTTVPFQVQMSAPGVHLVEARVSRANDPLSENNQLTSPVSVGAAPRVLYVERALGAGTVPQAALIQAGMDVSAALPSELRPDVSAYDRFDVVVLSDIAASEIAEPAMRALAAWVELGGGLLFAGGTTVLGDSADGTTRGYRRSELERILPVTFDRDDQPDVALVIVLDRSWSMNGRAMELSRAAAEAAANTLAPEQMLGVLSFSNDSTWDVPLGRVRDTRARWHEAIQRITASGPTAIYPALEQAFIALADVRARAKHVILLSDGRQDPDDFEGLVRKMAAARITVSSVALGEEADVDLLRNIAAWGGGRGYVVQDAQQIPEIFVKEARSAADRPDGEAAAVRPIVKHPGLFPGRGDGLPGVSGHNRVTRKPQALELAGLPGGDPLLTIWPAGLGRTAMLASDLDGGWSGDWLRWPRFGATLAAIVQSLGPERELDASFSVQEGTRLGTTEVVEVALDLRAPLPPGDQPTVTVQRRGQPTAPLRLLQQGPARDWATVGVDAAEPIVFRYVPGAASAAVVVDGAAEYRFGPPREPLLQDLARMTGGGHDATAEAVRSVPLRSGTVTTPMAPWLLAAAFGIWLADIYARRRWR